MKVDNVMWFLGSVAVAAGIVLAWQAIADARLVSPVFLPGPDRAWSALVAGMTTGDLAEKLLGTVERICSPRCSASRSARSSACRAPRAPISDRRWS